MSNQKDNVKKDYKEKDSHDKESYKRPLKQKYMKLEEPVTELTVIPEMPKDLIKEPNFD